MSDENASVPATQPERRPDIVAGDRGFVPRNFDEVLRYARMLLIAGAVPDSLSKEQGRQLSDNEVISRVVAVIAAGSEIGMGPMAAMANIALINKRRLIWGQGAVAVLQASGQLEDMRVERLGQEPSDSIETVQFADGFGIRVILKRKGQPTPFIGEFTVGQAKRAHLWMNTNKKTWIEHPERMLFWRAFNNAATSGFGDCLAGLGIREVFDEPPALTQVTDTSFLDAPKQQQEEPPAAALEAPRPLPAEPAERGEAATSTVASPGPSSTGERRQRRRRTKEEIARDMFAPDHTREEVVPVPDTVERHPSDNTEPPAETGGDREREPGEEG